MDPYSDPIDVEDLAMDDTIKPQGDVGQLTRMTKNGNQGAIIVAKPRQVGSVIRKIDEMAQIMGHRWKYRIPFKDNKTGRTNIVEGPTIGCAMAVARAWGNCDVSCERIEEQKGAWVFYGTFLDLETGFRVVRPFRQRTSAKIGNYGDDQGRKDDVTFLIGVSKAQRNAIVNALKDVVDEAVVRGEKRLVEKFAENRTEGIAFVLAKLEELEIDPDIVGRHFGQGIDKMNAAKHAVVYKTLQAIEDNLITAEDAFPIIGDLKPAPVFEMKAEVEGNGETEPGSKPRAKRVKLTFRGKEMSRTNFLRDIKQLLKECDTLQKVDDLSEECNTMILAMEDSEAVKIIDDDINPLFVEKYQSLGLEPEPERDEKIIHEPVTGPMEDLYEDLDELAT